jgi:hypothetical protein
MKRVLLLWVQFLVVCSLCGQQLNSLVRPVLWVKAEESLPGGAVWYDVSGNDKSLQLQTGMLPDSFTRLNFNPAYFIDNDYFTATGIHLTGTDATGIIVYRITDTLHEQGLWSLQTDSLNRVGLTTLRMLDEWGSIAYRDKNETITIVNTLFRQWNYNPDTTAKCFALLYADSLPFSGDIAECLLFDTRLNEVDVVKYISYLSLKYGITLFETDYLDGEGNIIWDYTNHSTYSYSIAGLGKDSVMGLNQKQTYILDNKIIAGFHHLELTNEENLTLIPEDEFLIWGFDSLLLTYRGKLFYDNGFSFDIYGNGLLQATLREENLPESSINQLPTFFYVDGSCWSDSLPLYYLLIDRSGSGTFLQEDAVFYIPDSVDDNHILYFSNVLWDADGNGADRFCFTYMDIDSVIINSVKSSTTGTHFAESSTQNSHHTGYTIQEVINADNKYREGQNIATHNFTEQSSQGNCYRLYPNPTQGALTLEVSYPTPADITVTLWSPDGKLLQTKEGKTQSHYQFDYSLSTAGQYLLEISGQDKKSFKVVKN